MRKRTDSSSKVLDLEALARTAGRLKASGSKIVLCNGDFDPIHVGDIMFFEEARRQGDVLIVTVTADAVVGLDNPHPNLPEQRRAQSVAALSIVDYVAVNRWPGAAEVVRLLHPNIFCPGGNGARPATNLQSLARQEAEAAVQVGAQVVQVRTEAVTAPPAADLAALSPNTRQWLAEFRERWPIDTVLGHLQQAAKLKALVVGEAIVDEYVFCDGLGKSSKDPILAFHYRSTETHAGGSLAVANHLAGICESVGLVTLLGETEQRQDFIRSSLQPNVQPRFVVRRGAPTIHKRRFVDTHTNAKVFELYMMDDTPMDAQVEASLTDELGRIINGYDVVVVTDYGHGMCTPAVIASLCKSARFLAVNTQANAGNRGFNTISRYPRADYVCLAGHEVALETRMRHASWQDLTLDVAKRIECPRFTVTQGRDGTLHYEREKGFTQVPALATRIKDRVGAGDAVLAVTSLLVAQGAPWEVVGLLGNVAGAQMVAELGNRSSVTQETLGRQVRSLLTPAEGRAL